MASRTPTVSYFPNGQQNCALAVWSGVLNGDTGDAVQLADFADRSVQIGGILGVGGSCSLEGSNDGVTFYALTDPQGNAITKTALGLEAIEECTRYVRPNATAGDGSTNFTVTLWARRNR